MDLNDYNPEILEHLDLEQLETGRSDIIHAIEMAEAGKREENYEGTQSFLRICRSKLPSINRLISQRKAQRESDAAPAAFVVKMARDIVVSDPTVPAATAREIAERFLDEFEDEI